MINYDKFSDNYKNCTTGLNTQLLKQAQNNTEIILNLLNRSHSIEIKPILFVEYRRIFSLIIRRFYEIIECRKNGLIYSINDQMRSIFELMLQAFYIIRSEEPEKIALDAYNVSFKSWYDKRTELLDLGFIDSSENSLLDEKKEMFNSVFSKYKGRPKFYTDLSVKKVAILAGLEKQHQMLYSFFSSLAHNEPFVNDDLKVLENGSPVIYVIPKNANMDRVDRFFTYANEIFIITTLAIMPNLMDVNRGTYTNHANELLKQVDSNFWKNEIELITDNFVK